jgi:hypothetical protein
MLEASGLLNYGGFARCGFCSRRCYGRSMICVHGGVSSRVARIAWWSSNLFCVLCKYNRVENPLRNTFISLKRKSAGTLELS